MKWSADEASSTFGVEGGGDAEEVGIHLEYCALVWSGMLGIRFRGCSSIKKLKGQSRAKVITDKLSASTWK